MNELTQKIKERQARLGLLPALASPRRLRDYADYLQSPHAPHMNGRCKAPLGFKRFCQASCKLERIQARLMMLRDSGQWDGREYRDLEREESKLCISLGC
jgi:hypothetical protein